MSRTQGTFTEGMNFEEYCIVNNRLDYLERWDYSSTMAAPSDYTARSSKSVYLKCPENRHESQQYIISSLTKWVDNTAPCKKCNSFAQYMIDTCGEDYFNLIWDQSLNNENPWLIGKQSRKSIVLRCDNVYEHIYDTYPDRVVGDGYVCPYCNEDSLIYKNMSNATKVVKMRNMWSTLNQDKPEDYTIQSSHNAWWKCDNNIHEDYPRSMSSSYNHNYVCPKCANTQQHKNQRKDLTGQRFGDIVVLNVDEEKSAEQKAVVWHCICDCGNECYFESTRFSGNTVRNCGDRSVHCSGENSATWKGGVTLERMRARASIAYENWRDSVYKKDWYTCQCCGRSHEIEKNAHHIRNLSDNNALRYEVSNGICLCKECHYTTIKGSFHNIYGTTNNTPEQIEEYINNRRKLLGISTPFSMIAYLTGDIIKPEEFGVTKEDIDNLINDLSIAM